MERETGLNISPRDVLHLIFKRKTPILLFLGTAMCTVAFVSFKEKPIYRATAQILVRVGRENVYTPTLPTGVTDAVITRKVEITAEIEILKSRFLAERVVESLGPSIIYPDVISPPSLEAAVILLQENLYIAAVGESNVISVRFEHGDPQMAARVVNILVDLYLERRLQVHKNPQPRAFFRMQAETLDRRAKLAEENLEAFKNQHDFTSLDKEQDLLLTQKTKLRDELHQTLSQKAEIEYRIKRLRDQMATTSEPIPLRDQTLQNLQAKLIELKLQEHELLTKYSDQSRLVQRVRDELEIVRNKLAEHRSDIIQQELFRYDIELEALKAKEKVQLAQLAHSMKRHEELNRIGLEFTRLQQEVEVHRQNYQLYLTKLEESRISDAMDKEKISNVSLIEPAHPPIEPEESNIPRRMVLATILGIVGGLGLAMCSEYLEDSLERDEDVESLLHLPVLASIPELKG